MLATFKQLVEIRSQLVEEVLAYLDALARRMATLPSYYPAHLRLDERGQTRFDAIRQMVQVMEDRSALEQWRAEEQERLHRVGLAFDRLAYDPTRARPELDERDNRDTNAHPELDEQDNRDTKRPKPPPPPVPWDEHAGKRFKRAIILGDPGFGKTWLLRYEARRLARQASWQLRERRIGLADLVLPLFARLSEVNQYDDPLEDRLVALASTGCSEAFRHFVREKLESEHCVILLDAWDEVPVEVPSDGQPIRYVAGFRQRLGQRLEAFARQFPEPRLLLTSRIVGYTTSPIPNTQELELLAFDLPQTEAFVQVWFGNEAQKISQFLSMLRQNHQVRGLARIPLMLALMCRAYQEQHLGFPTRRVKLYGHCLRGLLRDWKQEKDYDISDTYVEAMLELLQAVGYTLFAEGHEQFNESILRTAMATWLNNLPSTHEFASGQGHNASSLITELKRDGILISAGEGREAPLLFLHRTFHEYLAARALAQQANREGWPVIGNVVDKKAWLPIWQEVIILLAGQLRNPSPLLELLVDKKKDDYFRHRLGLAVLCLPECLSTSHDPKSKLVDRISEAAFKVWWSHKAAETEPVIAHLSRALPALAQVNGQVKGEPVLALLCKYLLDPDEYVRRSAVALAQVNGQVKGEPVLTLLCKYLLDPRRDVCRRAVETLEQMGTAAAHPEVLSALIATLDNRDGNVYWSARWALGQLGAATAQPEVLSALLAALHDPYEYVRRNAVEAAEWMGAAAQPEVLSALLTALHDPDEYVRQGAVTALGQMGAAAAQPEVLLALLTALHGPDEYVHIFAATALGQLGAAAAQPEVLSALLAALHGPDGSIHIFAARVLGRMGAAAAQPEVLSALLAALHGPDEYVRPHAMEALGQMGAAAVQPEVLSALLTALLDPDGSAHGSAAWALGRMGAAAAQPQVLSALLTALLDPRGDVRRRAVNMLERMGAAAAQPEVLSALLVALHDPIWYVREGAVKALGRMGAATAQPEVLSALLTALYDPERIVRQGAVEALGQLGAAAAQPEVLSALLAALRDPDEYVRRNAVEAAGRMGVAAQPEVLSALLTALHDPKRTVRQGAVQALGQMGAAAAQPEVLSALLTALHGPDWGLRGYAATALERMGTVAAQPEVLWALLAALHDPEKSVRQSAAKALGMITQEVRIFRRWWGKVKVKRLDELANQ